MGGGYMFRPLLRNVPTGHAHVQNKHRDRRTQTPASLQKVGPGYPLQYLQAVKTPSPF
jgi:hypothetical protein